MAMIAVVLTASNPQSELVFIDSCDYVEINHVYNINEETGKPTLRMIQYIWWEWRNMVLLPVRDPVTKQRTGDWKSGSDFVVREYLVTYSGSSSPNNVNPVLSDKDGNVWFCIFWDKSDKVMRRIKCGWLITSHTLHDPEVENRNIVHQDNRNRFQKRQK